jgi:long-chain acyl-CoA synthetase
LRIARRLVFSQFQKAFGGNIKLIISGGSALQVRLAQLFNAVGFDISEGYELSETSPVIAVNLIDWKDKKLGTVGPVLEGVEVKIADDGEILTRGNCVMKGYYKAPELTREVIDDDGWFHTGDIGHLEPEGQLRITGRKKEMFKTAFGKYVVPTLIEGKFAEDPLIDNMLVVGENKPFAAALIVPEFGNLRSWCARKGIEYTTNEEMVKNPEVLKKFKKIVDHYNKFFGETEKVSRYQLVDYEWGIQTGELTPTLKLRRSFIMKKYHDDIERLFEK